MNCPSCGFEYTYEEGDMMICSACQFSWKKDEDQNKEFVLDANGNKLFDGDSVIVIKDLKIKRSSDVIKQGTKIDNIKIQEGDHNISCRIPAFGRMDLKSEFLKKV